MHPPLELEAVAIKYMDPSQAINAAELEGQGVKGQLRGRGVVQREGQTPLWGAFLRQSIFMRLFL